MAHRTKLRYWLVRLVPRKGDSQLCRVIAFTEQEAKTIATGLFRAKPLDIIEVRETTTPLFDGAAVEASINW